jgi:nucleoside-diphosphate-sugar epimerase
MKVAVTGANGFIGKSFCDYAKESSSFDVLEFVREPHDGQFAFDLADPIKANNSFKGVNTVVHCAFDHSYRFNSSGLRSLIEICKSNNVSRLVFLSSISVYDQEVIGEVDEVSQYSNLNDPYSNEKQYLENLLLNVSEIDIVILQPTIVYGEGSVWESYVKTALSHSVVCIPNNGKDFCNVTYIEDLNKAIQCCITPKVPSLTKFIVSSEVISWKDFYLRIANKIGQEEVVFSNCEKKYHNSPLINYLYLVWYETRIGLLINRFTPVLKSLRSVFLRFKKKKQLSRYSSGIKDKISSSFYSTGITRLYHSCSFIAVTSKLRKHCLTEDVEVKNE